MNFSEAKYTGYLSEDELKEAIEYYMLNKCKRATKITHLKHKTKSWTEGGGGMPEIDYTVDDGVEFTCVGEYHE